MPPKTTPRGETVADTLAAWSNGAKNDPRTTAAKLLIKIAGGLTTTQLSAKQVNTMNLWLQRYENAFSRHRRAGATRTIFRRLWEDHGAPKLHHLVIKCNPPKPRNVTATDKERAMLIAGAPPHLRLWLLLCSDLAIRSGTATLLGPENYDQDSKTLSFRTKYQHTQRFQVTAEIAGIVANLDGNKPWVAQLRPQGTATYHQMANDFTALKKRLGIKRKLTPHDLRRTTARKVYALTSDLRDVQSLLGHSELQTTMWYLQDDLQVVKLSTLERAKLPLSQQTPATEVIQ